MRQLVFILTLVYIAAAQHQALIDYLERRLLAIEDRISLWQEQTTRYASELRELKLQMVSQLESLDKEKETLRINLDGVGTRVDRVERELDYLETQNGAQPCVDVDDRLIEQQVTLVKEKQKAKYLKLTGVRVNDTGMQKKDPIGTVQKPIVIKGKSLKQSDG